MAAHTGPPPDKKMWSARRAVTRRLTRTTREVYELCRGEQLTRRGVAVSGYTAESTTRDDLRAVGAMPLDPVQVRRDAAPPTQLTSRFPSAIVGHQRVGLSVTQ